MGAEDARPEAGAGGEPSGWLGSTPGWLGSTPGWPGSLAGLWRQWLVRLEDELPGAVALRHELHAHPDLSGAEEGTTRRVLAAIDAGPGQPVAGTGAVLRLGPAGPAVGVRAELDALPLSETTGAAFAAPPGAMHACGHDVHLAAVTALARAARELDLPAGLVVLLQPREEVGPTGAADVVSAGILPALDVRYLIGAHVQPQLAAGVISADPGPVNAAVDEIEVEVIGRGGHGAYPQLAVDPVPALCRIVLGMQDVLRSAVDPMQPAVISMTQLSGAAAPNVIPGTARAAGTVRTMRPQDAQALHAHAARMVEQVAAGHGCTGRYLVRRGEPSLHNDAALAARARGWLSGAGVALESFASCGSDDFANYGGVLPILMLFVGTAGPAQGAGAGHHLGGVEVSGRPMLHEPGFLPSDDAVREVAVAQMAGWLAGVQTLLEVPQVPPSASVVADA
jgi:amidohydrolase